MMRYRLVLSLVLGLAAAACASGADTLVGTWQETASKSRQATYESFDSKGRPADGGGTAQGRAVRVGS